MLLFNELSFKRNWDVANCKCSVVLLNLLICDCRDKVISYLCIQKIFCRLDKSWKNKGFQLKNSWKVLEFDLKICWPPCLSQIIFKFCTFLHTFSNILGFFALFYFYFFPFSPLFLKIACMPLEQVLLEHAIFMCETT